MRMTTKRARIAALVMSAAAIAPLTLSGEALAANPANPAAGPIHGTLNGFSNGDFLYLDALNVGSLSLAKVALAQSASGVSNKGLQTENTLGEKLLTTKSPSGHNAYARTAGIDLGIGQGANTTPQVQLTQGEVVSPPRNQVVTKKLLGLPLKPLLNADVQPDIAVANTRSNSDFCVLGKNTPLASGAATIADAQVLPVTPGTDLLTANGTVRNISLEQLDPNGHGALGLNSVDQLNTAEIDLFKGIPGATIRIKVINPLILSAFAGGEPGTAKVHYGGKGKDASKPVLSITAGGSTQTLTAEQLLGTNGVTIDADGLLKIQIGGKPTINTAADGTTASAVADLISVQVISLTGTSGSSVGGPLGPILQPILDPVLKALDQLTSALDKALTSAGIKAGVDLRVGHFEANSQVPAGGIHCGIPVSKTANPNPVTAGHVFTVNIAADNPYDCTIKNLRFEDDITADGGIHWKVVSAQPNPTSRNDDTQLVWSNLGSIPPGGHKSVQVHILVNKDSESGKMHDTAHVTGTCATGNGPGTANVHLGGQFTLNGPQVNGAKKPTVLPNTGLSPLVPIGGGLLLAVGLGLAVLRRRSLG